MAAVILRITALTDGGAEITALNIPMPDAEWALLTDEQISAKRVTPYLENLRTDTFLWAGICRKAGVTTQKHGPA